MVYACIFYIISLYHIFFITCAIGSKWDLTKFFEHIHVFWSCNIHECHGFLKSQGHVKTFKHMTEEPSRVCIVILCIQVRRLLLKHRAGNGRPHDAPRGNGMSVPCSKFLKFWIWISALNCHTSSPSTSAWAMFWTGPLMRKSPSIVPPGVNSSTPSTCRDFCRPWKDEFTSSSIQFWISLRQWGSSQSVRFANRCCFPDGSSANSMVADFTVKPRSPDKGSITRQILSSSSTSRTCRVSG